MYAAAALATAVTTLASLAFTPASGVSAPPAAPALPYIVTAYSRADARALVGEVRWRVRRYYTAALPGFATLLSDREAAELGADPRVRSLEPDLRLHPTAGRPPRPPRATNVYVLGAGTTGQVRSAFDATGGTGANCSDVADLIPDRARVVSVRVIGCDGTATMTDLLAGLDWVRRHARRPAAVFVPFSGVRSPALEVATRRLNRGLHLEPQPPALASWPKSITTRGAIRQNPSRTPVHSGGF